MCLKKKRKRKKKEIYGGRKAHVCMIMIKREVNESKSTIRKICRKKRYKTTPNKKKILYGWELLSWSQS